MKLTMSMPSKGFLSIIALFVFSLFLGGSQSFAQDGEALFKNNCASCHAVDKRVTGPPLRGAQERWAEAGEAELLYEWVKNSSALISSGKSARAKELEDFDPSAMTPQAVTNDDIDAIFVYVEASTKEVVAVTGDAVPYVLEVEESNDGWKMKLVIAIILAFVVFAMAGVNRRLKEASDDVETDFGRGKKAFSFSGFWLRSLER